MCILTSGSQVSASSPKLTTGAAGFFPCLIHLLHLSPTASQGFYSEDILLPSVSIVRILHEPWKLGLERGCETAVNGRHNLETNSGQDKARSQEQDNLMYPEDCGPRNLQMRGCMASLSYTSSGLKGRRYTERLPSPDSICHSMLSNKV